MPPELLPALAKAASDSGLLQQLYGDLLKPGVAQVGKALSTVLGLGNTILWPVQLLNERTRIALDINLESYRSKLVNVPIEKIQPVPPEIGVPIAEKLSYVSDVDLREMYSTLLKSASITDTQSNAHPSFVNILNNLSPDEAQILLQFRRQGGNIPFISVRVHKPGMPEFHTLVDSYFQLEQATNVSFLQNVPAYTSNLEGLGLIRVRTDVRLSAVDVYPPLEEEMRTQYKEVTEAPASMTLSFGHGKIEITRFGWLFLASCVTQ